MVTVYDMATWEEVDREARPTQLRGMQLPGYGEGSAPMVEPRLATWTGEACAQPRRAPVELIEELLAAWEE